MYGGGEPYQAALIKAYATYDIINNPILVKTLFTYGTVHRNGCNVNYQKNHFIF